MVDFERDFDGANAVAPFLEARGKKMLIMPHDHDVAHRSPTP